MSEIRDKVRTRIDYYISSAVCTSVEYPKGMTWEQLREKILAIPELAIVDREAQREFYDEGHQVEVEIPDGWVKEVKV